VSYAIDVESAEFKRQLDRLDGQIRSEARKRCLDELEAFSKGEDIESGVGVDVERAYLLLIQRHEQKDGFVSR
jgi:hypothetical protein